MDKDEILKQIQSWTNNVPLIVLGSGASVPFGQPSMWKLGEYIKDNVVLTEKDDQSQFAQFVDIFDRIGDLETSLSELYLRENVLNQIVFKTWELINKHDLKLYNQLLSKTINFPLASLLEHLLSAAGKKVSIITTNYDRIAEFAASFAKAIICTGYSQNFIGHFSNSIHSNNLATLKGYKGQVNIWKVHGSLDWFKSIEDENIQLPLQHELPLNFKPSIVTPGLSKYYETHNEPYRTIFAQADNEIETANGYLCVGYGFNDSHVQPKLIEQIKRHKPIIVITKELTTKAKQTIIDAKCKNYILIEQSGANDTKVYSSSYGEHIFTNESFWALDNFLKLII